MKKALLLLLALVLSACSNEWQADLSMNRAKWNEANISHYRYHLYLMCLCSFFEDMPLVIEVLNGKVVSMEFQSGNLIKRGDRKSFEANATIARIFARLQTDFWKNPDEVFVDYDQTYGFPTQVRIDYSKDFGEDDFSLIVSDFEVLP